MYTADVEIFSDEPNAAVIRHPERKFPGVLVQGDTLHALARQAADAAVAVNSGHPDAAEEVADLAARLDSLLSHYRTVLAAHGHKLPFPQ
ncbi:DUF6959 family protein [Thermomonas brevis]